MIFNKKTVITLNTKVPLKGKGSQGKGRSPTGLTVGFPAFFWD
jgi:hypothetical protein